MTDTRETEEKSIPGNSISDTSEQNITMVKTTENGTACVTGRETTDDVGTGKVDMTETKSTDGTEATTDELTLNMTDVNESKNTDAKESEMTDPSIDMTTNNLENGIMETPGSKTVGIPNGKMNLDRGENTGSQVTDSTQDTSPLPGEANASGMAPVSGLYE